ncbi:hypothetical protein NC651_014693 [Populus alba x Populus x berolinensis]|nr:hypothetical protein NC651_014693 [Populus alba x Populus x berolinensis]
MEIRILRTTSRIIFYRFRNRGTSAYLQGGLWNLLNPKLGPIVPEAFVAYCADADSSLGQDDKR